MLRSVYASLKIAGPEPWVLIPEYEIPAGTGWNREKTEVSLVIPPGYPGHPPYGIYVPAGVLCHGRPPSNYREPAPTAPPFPGSWGIFSWAPAGPWPATADPTSGPNLVNWVRGFADRFREGP